MLYEQQRKGASIITALLKVEDTRQSQRMSEKVYTGPYRVEIEEVGGTDGTVGSRYRTGEADRCLLMTYSAGGAAVASCQSPDQIGSRVVLANAQIRRQKGSNKAGEQRASDR